MSYPEYVIVTLNEVDGNSCGDLNHRFEFQDGSDPPEYKAIRGEGDFLFGIGVGVPDGSGGIETFELVIRVATGTCSGLHWLRRNPSADNPTGNYCMYSGGQLDCDAAKATVVAE